MAESKNDKWASRATAVNAKRRARYAENGDAIRAARRARDAVRRGVGSPPTIAVIAPKPAQPILQKLSPVARPPARTAPIVGTRKVLIIPDCHHPYVNQRAWDLLLRVAAEVRFHDCLVLGDFIDLASLSMHPKRLQDKFITFKAEIDAANAALDQLDTLGFQRKKFCEGNHEDRLGRYLAAHPELIGVVSTESALRLTDRGWKFCEYRTETRVGKLWATHDFDNAGMNAHHQALAKVGASVVVGHTHRIGYAVRGKIGGQAQVGAMFGWLGDHNAVSYKSRGSAVYEWAHGFGVGILEPSGVCHINPCPIVGGRVCVFGKVYSL